MRILSSGRIEILLTVAFVNLALRIDTRLIVAPENTAVVSGTHVTLKCSTDSENLIIWKLLRNRSSSTFIYTGTKIMSEFSNSYEISTPGQGKTNLKFVATKDTASTYSCEEAGGRSVEAELIVLASEPKCFAKSIDDVNWFLECRGVVWGNWIPTMEWSQTKGIGTRREVSRNLVEGIHQTYRDNNLVSTLRISENRSENDTGYKCIVRFTESRRPKNLTAKNVPTYSFTWTNYEDRSDGVANESNSGATLTTVATCLVLLIVIVFALSGYIIYTKRKRANEIDRTVAVDSPSSSSAAAAAAVGLLNLPNRETSVESHYVELPKKESNCQRSTCSGDYSSLHADQYTSLELYTALDA